MEHILKLCTLSEYNRWEAGDVVYHPKSKSFIPIHDVKDEQIFKEEDYNIFNEYGSIYEALEKQENYRKSHFYFNKPDTYLTYGTSSTRLGGYFKCLGIVDGIEIVAFGEF